MPNSDIRNIRHKLSAQELPPRIPDFGHYGTGRTVSGQQMDVSCESRNESEVLSLSGVPFCDSPQGLPCLTRFAYVCSRNKDEAGECLKYVILDPHPDLLVSFGGQHFSSICSNLHARFQPFYTARPQVPACLFLERTGTGLRNPASLSVQIWIELF